MFLNNLSAVKAPMVETFGVGLPGFGGGAAISQGSVSSGNELVMRLRYEATLFAREYVSPERDEASLDRHAKEIEGSLLALQTISVITQQKINELIDELYSLLS